MRPRSILLFERLYLGSIAVYLINAAAFWAQTQETVRLSPAVADNPPMAMYIGALMIGSLLLTTLVSVLFWYLAARARSVVGKWCVVVTEAIGAIMALLAVWSLAQGTSPYPASVVGGLVSTALAIAAAVVLFRPDARAWLDEDEQAE